MLFNSAIFLEYIITKHTTLYLKYGLHGNPSFVLQSFPLSQQLADILSYIPQHVSVHLHAPVVLHYSQWCCDVQLPCQYYVFHNYKRSRIESIHDSAPAVTKEINEVKTV